MKLKDKWIVNSYVGFTATTGQLADNHDIISFQAFSDSEVMEYVENNTSTRREFERGSRLTTEERLNRIEDSINSILQQISFIDHHVEHELVSVEDKLVNLLGKLEKKEDISENRIATLEEVFLPKYYISSNSLFQQF